MLTSLELKDILPPLRRFSMAYQPYACASALGLSATLFFRRFILFVLVAACSWCAQGMISTVLNSSGNSVLHAIIVGIFTILFGWISITLWTAVMGFVLLMSRHKPFEAGLRLCAQAGIDGSCRIAVVMPVFNEDVQRVFAGLKVMYESLSKTGQVDHFDFFILSDTNQPSLAQEEELAWANLCDQLQGTGRIFYRRRKIRIHKKSGNISDFCRRWGVHYKYMIVLDADSLLSGNLMVNMVQTMEYHKQVGILQTAPKGFNQKSLVARVNQFCCHLYGPLLLAGAYFLQLDEGGFWGHNAIVRMEPFMKFCALPKLSGKPPFGGEILSHDFIEAALMRRAGWGVWLAYDLEDSFEELPPDLNEEFKRDRRWARGNLQHLRLMFMKGIRFGHRFLFFNGNMFYFSALLWLSMLMLMTSYSISALVSKAEYFNGPHRLFPDWPIHYNPLSIKLLLVTMLFLFLPKLLSVIWVVSLRRQHLFGGLCRLLISVFLETIVSILLAPIRMMAHSWFVLSGLRGGQLEWKSQYRSHQKLSLGQAFMANWLVSIMAMAWAWVAFEINRTLFLWLSLVVLPLSFSIPLLLLVNCAQAGKFFESMGIFMTPVECRPPEVVRALRKFWK